MVAALVVGSWWVLLGAVLVHAVVTAFVIGARMKLFSQVEKPRSEHGHQARAVGVDDPEGAVNELVGQVRRSRER